MKKVKLQVPMTMQLHKNSEKKAQQMGFSSLQEFVRVFLTNVTQDSISVQIINKNIEHITNAQLARLNKDYKEFLDYEQKGQVVTSNTAQEHLIELLK